MGIPIYILEYNECSLDSNLIYKKKRDKEFSSLSRFFIVLFKMGKQKSEYYLKLF